MSDQFPMFEPMISERTGNVISSLESASGVTPSGSQDGQMTAKSGLVPAHASRSARLAKARRSTTKGIFGQSGFHSSKHDDLSFALASRLRPLTDSLGSTLFSLTWMTRITPAGRSISALRASEPLTDDSVFIGWPTLNTPSGGPNVKSTKTHTGGMDLDEAALLSSWPTTRATDAEKNVRTAEGAAREMERKGGPQDLIQAALLTPWGTPAARDWKNGKASQETLGKNARPLSELAMLAEWKTLCVPNGGRISGNDADIGKHRCACLVNEARSTAFGDQPIGYLLGPNGWEIVPASGQLNPSHSRWLMGLPQDWDVCGYAKRRGRGAFMFDHMPNDSQVSSLLRGDEKLFWRRANQHPAWRREAGL